MRRVRGSQWAALVVAAGALLAGCVPPAPPPPPPPSGPDLVATDITWPTPLVIGERVPFSITVSNIGDTATPPNTILDVLITLDVDTPNAADIGWSDNITVPLAPGESRTQVVNGGPDGSDGLWTVDEGAHNVRAYVNSGSLPVRPPIVESNRQNNFYLETFTVEGPPRTDQIVFVGPFGGIWKMAPTANSYVSSPATAFQPEVSRDGTRDRLRPRVPDVVDDPQLTYTHIWVMNADGSDQHEVYVAPPPSNCNGFCEPFVQPADTIQDRSPSWSPDGTEIAFVRRPINLTLGGVFVMSAEGGELRPIFAHWEDRFEGTAWSPDGATIAVVYNYVMANTHINLYAADGSGFRPALLGNRNGADNQTVDRNPSWSADSTRIAFNGSSQPPRGDPDPRPGGELDPGPLPPLPIGQSGMWVATVPTSRHLRRGGDISALTTTEHHAPGRRRCREPLVLARRHSDRFSPRRLHLVDEGDPRLRRDRPRQPRRPRKRSELGPVSPFERWRKHATFSTYSIGELPRH